MSNITVNQLTQYDNKIKTYIQQQISLATKGYQDILSNLNNTIIQQASKIENLENSLELLKSMDSNNGRKDSEVPILRSISPDTIIVSEDIQEDYIIYDRIISPNEDKVYRNIVVTTDNKSNRLFFSMWKTFDNRELTESGKVLSVVWINSDGLRGETRCEDIRIIGNRLYFSWNIPGSATPHAGIIRFAIRIKGEDYAWHTLPYEITCMQGIMDGNWDEMEEATDNISWVDWLESNYEALISIITEEEYNSIQEKSEILYVVKMLNGTINLYLGEHYINTSKWSALSN